MISAEANDGVGTWPLASPELRPLFGICHPLFAADQGFDRSKRPQVIKAREHEGQPLGGQRGAGVAHVKVKMGAAMVLATAIPALCQAQPAQAPPPQPSKMTLEGVADRLEKLEAARENEKNAQERVRWSLWLLGVLGFLWAVKGVIESWLRSREARRKAEIDGAALFIDGLAKKDGVKREDLARNVTELIKKTGDLSLSVESKLQEVVGGLEKVARELAQRGGQP